MVSQRILQAHCQSRTEKYSPSLGQLNKLEKA
jgi:hypothetical protein